ncbi:MAG: Hsp20/alpha crystallin family protein [bacterium]|nr:Hsp20/alpha crystallin family protein [bacterium]
MKKSIFDKLTGSTKIVPQEAPDAYPTNESEESSAPEESEEGEEGQLALDVFQTENDIVIKSTVAGVAAEDIDITVTGDMVTIRGERKQDEEIPPEHYYYQECYWGPFSRSVILPVDIDADRIDAAIKNGILTIRLPKIEKEKTRKLKVRIE